MLQQKNANKLKSAAYLHDPTRSSVTENWVGIRCSSAMFDIFACLTFYFSKMHLEVQILTTQTFVRMFTRLQLIATLSCETHIATFMIALKLFPILSHYLGTLEWRIRTKSWGQRSCRDMPRATIVGKWSGDVANLYRCTMIMACAAVRPQSAILFKSSFSALNWSSIHCTR